MNKLLLTRQMSKVTNSVDTDKKIINYIISENYHNIAGNIGGNLIFELNCQIKILQKVIFNLHVHTEINVYVHMQCTMRSIMDTSATRTTSIEWTLAWIDIQ